MRLPALLIGAAAALVVTAPAHAADPAQQRIDAYHQAVIAIAHAGGTLASRTAKFETVVRDYYAMPVITALVVGPAWTAASAADKAAVIAALTKHSAVQLASNFASFSGVATAEPAVVSRGSDKLVRATLGGTPLVYRLRSSGGHWAIVDVLAGGVSQLAVQRSDFSATVASGGAAGLAKRLTATDAKTLAGR